MPPEVTLTDLPDEVVRGVARRGQRGVGETGTLFAKVLWDGVNGEVHPCRITNRLRRKFRRYERQPHLVRQFYPKRRGR